MHAILISNFMIGLRARSHSSSTLPNSGQQQSDVRFATSILGNIGGQLEIDDSSMDNHEYEDNIALEPIQWVLWSFKWAIMLNNYGHREWS